MYRGYIQVRGDDAGVRRGSDACCSLKIVFIPPFVYLFHDSALGIPMVLGRRRKTRQQLVAGG